MSLLSSILGEPALSFLDGDVLDRLPLGPDDTGPALTGASHLAREDAFTYAALAAAPRLVEVLGPANTGGVVVGDDVFALVRVFEDEASGFRAVQLRERGGEHRMVFAVDGTQNDSANDVMAGLDLARPQAESPAFDAMVAAARNAALRGYDPVFTGASLGGAVAQAGGYEAAEAILAAAPGHAGVVTVLGIDALGGRDAAESLNGGGLDPAVLAHMNALNIRTAGDLVSRIGSPIGDTLTFPPVDAEGRPVDLPAGDEHVDVGSLFATLRSDALWAAGERGAPGEIGAAALIANALGPAASDAYDWFGLDALLDRPEAPNLPGIAGPDASGQFFDLDADADGTTDLRLYYAGVRPGAEDLLAG
jgi:hypothetical protein